MSLPIDLKKILGDVQPDAYAQLNATFGSPIGETHFVVVEGRMRVFTRESLIGDFEEVQLDEAHPPKLEKGGFSDTLHVALKNGESYDFNVGSFERENVKAVLDAAGSGDGRAAPQTDDTRTQRSHSERFKEGNSHKHEHGSFPPAGSKSGAESKSGGDYARRGKGYNSSDNLDYAATRSEGYAAGKNRGYSAEEATGYAAERAEGYGAEKSHGYRTEKSREYDSDAEEVEGEKVGGAEVFKSSDPGCAGCIMQLALFAGAIAGFWFLHVVAMENASAYFGWGDLDPEGGAWIGTKIVAIVCGGYVGGKLAGLVTRFAKSQMWGGAVLFKDDVMVVFGPRSKWNKRFFLKNDLNWDCRWYTSSSSDDKDQKRSYHAAVDILQDGTKATLRTTFQAKQVNFHVKNMSYTKLESVPSNEGTVTLDAKTFRKVLFKVADFKAWRA